ncbi:hypothetical protein EDB87DRAFT_1263827 [Lactarius vividus]|nr:hypothetical protein EDB87DRAFT_1263827 [Lactarius vividus]
MFYPLHDSHISSNDRSHLDVQASIPSALAAGFNVHAPLKLTSLSLGSMCVWKPSPLESPSFQTVLKGPYGASYCPCSSTAPEPQMHARLMTHWCHFWGTLYPRTILAPTQHTLTELTMHGDIPVGASSGLSLAGLHFPLCALSLRGLFFQPSTGVEPFILRHAPTLAQLQVIACKLPAPAPANLSLSYFRTISARRLGPHLGPLRGRAHRRRAGRRYRVPVHRT